LNICAVCLRDDPTLGLLCDDCRDELASPFGLVPEQIMATAARPTDAALIDRWGRPHRLAERAVVGRVAPATGDGVLIIDGSVSRRHGEVSRDGDGRWWVHDHGSRAGTRVAEQPVGVAVEVRHGDRVVFGPIGFYFVVTGSPLPDVAIDPSAFATARPDDRRAAAVDTGDFVEEGTDSGLPHLAIRLHEPTGGGGGLIAVGGLELQLSTAQLELLQLLIQRMRDDAGKPGGVRGFVRSSELIGTLSWESRDPSDEHVKQLVRRLRRALVKAQIGDLIEARRGFGYRLAVVPTVLAPPG
jgi:hypothetical protein